MLIIFDLDDTLIDTSGSITPFRLEKAVRRMHEEGLFLEDLTSAIEIIKRLDTTTESSAQTLFEFLEIHGAMEDKFLSIGKGEIYEAPLGDIAVQPLEGIPTLLYELQAEHTLCLVTVGSEKLQEEKLKKAGIDCTIFSKIYVCKEKNKKPYYQRILEELKALPSQTVVCGDRIAIDLSPAKELGMHTIHMRWGRGIHTKKSPIDVDFAIFKLEEIKAILAHIMAFSS